MNVLVDSSVWIDYFRGRSNALGLDDLISQDLVCVNDLILTELIPFLRLQNQNDLIGVLENVLKAPLEINWKTIVDYQTLCLRKGINRVGIPDLIIAQNCIQNDLYLFSFDKHFGLMGKHIPLKMYQ